MTHFKKKVGPSNHFTSQLGPSSLVDCPSILVHFGKFKLVFSVDNARILSPLMSRSFYDTIFYQNIKKSQNPKIRFIGTLNRHSHKMHMIYLYYLVIIHLTNSPCNLSIQTDIKIVIEYSFVWTGFQIPGFRPVGQHKLKF